VELASAELLISLLPGIEKDLTVQDYIAQTREAQEREWPLVQLMPGAKRLIEHLHKHSVPMAVATASGRSKTELKIKHDLCPEDKKALFKLFGKNILCGDDPGVLKGKPAPDIFLRAAHMIGRDVGNPEDEPTEAQIEERKKGLVFEDAIPGVQAGLKAGMNVIWVPDPNLLALDPGLEVVPLSSLEEFKPESWGLPPYDQ
jgi:pseudouridine-5'-monophosphatase